MLECFITLQLKIVFLVFMSFWSHCLTPFSRMEMVLSGATTCQFSWNSLLGYQRHPSKLLAWALKLFSWLFGSFTHVCSTNNLVSTFLLIPTGMSIGWRWYIMLPLIQAKTLWENLVSCLRNSFCENTTGMEGALWLVYCCYLSCYSSIHSCDGI